MQLAQVVLARTPQLTYMTDVRGSLVFLRPLQLPLDLKLGLIGELVPVAREELDPVVLVLVV
jgi:hypothetical protein